MVDLGEYDDVNGTWSDIGARPARSYEVAKRAIDLAVSIAGLLIALPFAIVIWLAIRIESGGPVWFHQERIGRFGVPFNIRKFRTMYCEADESIHQDHVLKIYNSDGGSQPSLRLTDDPRITRVGQFLRRWSLDELPNIYNVVKGEMSLVGPRPLVPYEVNALERAALVRFAVKPGVTGLAQVNGRLESSAPERTDYDLRYVDEPTFWGDLLILIRTPMCIVNRPGV